MEKKQAFENVSPISPIENGDFPASQVSFWGCRLTQQMDPEIKV